MNKRILLTFGARCLTSSRCEAIIFTFATKSWPEKRNKTVTTVKHIYGNNNIFPKILLHGCSFNCSLILCANLNESTRSSKEAYRLRARLHGGGGPQISEETRGRSPHLSCKHDQIKMRDYMDRWVTPSKQVTSPTCGPSPPCKLALKLASWVLPPPATLHSTPHGLNLSVMATFPKWQQPQMPGPLSKGQLKAKDHDVQ